MSPKSSSEPCVHCAAPWSLAAVIPEQAGPPPAHVANMGLDKAWGIVQHVVSDGVGEALSILTEEQQHPDYCQVSG